MIVRVEYPEGYGKNFEVNPLKGTVRCADDGDYDRLFVVLPAEKSTFRIRHFPFNDRRKILKIVESDVKSTPFLSEERLVCRSLFFPDGDGTTVLTVIVRESDIDAVREKEADSIDSEVFALLRAILFEGKRDGDFYYQKKKSTVLISVRRGVPVAVRVLAKGVSEGEPISCSGISHELIPLFGSALQLVRNLEVNFLKEESSGVEGSFLKAASLLFLSLVFLSAVLFGGSRLFKREAKRIRKIEASLFREKFPDVPAVDPLTQLKGMLASREEKGIDAVDVLNIAGRVKGEGISVLKFNAGDGRFSIEGKAPDIASATAFAGKLRRFNAEITETVTLKDGIRFRLEGRY
ncbi:hypothetical protein [Desulfurobacterium sp.]